jgi:hypothetical protein
MDDVFEILKEEWPPNYTGIKYNGKKVSVYRVNGDFGLVFHLNTVSMNHVYKWEHFESIKEIGKKNRWKEKEIGKKNRWKEMCREISEATYNMVNGDDVCSEPISADERKRMEGLLHDELETLMDQDEVECIVIRDMMNIHKVLVTEGYINV